MGYKNPFHYHEVKLNLPGSKDYIPGAPWFATLRKDGSLASLLAIYVDDETIHASTKILAQQSARQVALRERYLGIQDAARKRRPPSQQAGAWVGSIARTNSFEVGILVSNERWQKNKLVISKWLDLVNVEEYPSLDTKSLLSDRDFLVYIARTYEVLVHYLKGLHLTIDGWRSDRDEDG